MTGAFELILIAASLVAIAPALFFAVETAGAFLPARRFKSTGSHGPIAVIVPAHNEGAGIAATLADITAQLRPNDRLIVVADNCTDDTAEKARAAGAEVFTRDDPQKRGKGYALQFALDALRDAPPEIVAFFDADCRLEEGALEKIAETAAATERPVQALYLMTAPAGAPARLSVAAFAWLVVNRVRMRGLDRLAGVTRLTGSGMAAPWKRLADLDLASGDIVEDLGLSIALARRGAAAILREDAVVTSVFPVSEDAAVKQRARWEHGSLGVMRARGLPLLVEGLRKGNLRLAALALDLFIPPLTVLGALIAALTVLTAPAVFFGLSTPFALALAAAALFGSALAAAWTGFGRGALPPAALGGLARYLADKLGVYGRTGKTAAASWTRTERPGEGDKPAGGDGEAK
ncbi:MAG: glycosyltransferase family 2 protein [Parvularculaceae bacterium]